MLTSRALTSTAQYPDTMAWMKPQYASSHNDQTTSLGIAQRYDMALGRHIDEFIKIYINCDSTDSSDSEWLPLVLAG